MATDEIKTTETPGLGGAEPERELTRDLSRDFSRDFSRDLGVIEAITYVTRACPSGVVVGAATRALDTIKAKGSGEMKNQAYFVLTAMKGWRGDGATQVHRSLKRYLDEGTDPGSSE